MVQDLDAITLKEWLDRKEDIIVIDARANEDFIKGHIDDAVSILLSEVDSKASSYIKKNIPIIVYSNDEDCPASGLVAEKLDKLGYFPVYNYNPSYADWVKKGFPVTL